MNNNNYCVYIHKFPNNKLYIGITKQTELCKRWQNGFGYKNQKVYRAIQKYGWENIKHIVLYKNFTMEQALWKEKLLIKLFNTYIYDKNSNGYNCTIGGEGANGHKLNKDQIEAIRERKKKENLSQETLKRMREAKIGKEPWNKGKKMTQEWKNKNKCDKKYSFKSGGNNPRSKSCICENVVYPTIKECWENYKDEIKYDTLKSYLNGKRKMSLKWLDRGLSYINL